MKIESNVDLCWADPSYVLERFPILGHRHGAGNRLIWRGAGYSLIAGDIDRGIYSFGQRHSILNGRHYLGVGWCHDISA